MRVLVGEGAATSVRDRQVRYREPADGYVPSKGWSTYRAFAFDQRRSLHR